MASIPARVINRITSALKKLQPILASAKSRDIGESDTVVVVNEILQEVFGYDKFLEITSEYAIRGTFCDLAVKLDGKLTMLIEVKAIGLEPKDAYIKQAVDYGSNEGCEWVTLTTGIVWRVYKILFKKPIEFDLVCEFNLMDVNVKDEEHFEPIWLLCKESWQKETLTKYHAQRQAMSRYTLAAMLTSEPILDDIRRELRKMTPDVKIDVEEIEKILLNEVIKRDVLEGEKAESARNSVTKAIKRAQRAKSGKSSDDCSDDEKSVSEPVQSQSTTQHAQESNS